MVLIVARKWGKSTFISALGLYLTCADQEPTAQVWCLATVKAQVEIVWQNTVDYAIDSPVLRNHLRRRKDTSGHRLGHEDSKSCMKAGDRNSQTKDGSNPHAVIIDELQAIKDRNTYGVMSSAMGCQGAANSCQAPEPGKQCIRHMLRLADDRPVCRRPG